MEFTLHNKRTTITVESRTVTIKTDGCKLDEIRADALDVLKKREIAVLSEGVFWQEEEGWAILRLDRVV